MSNLKFFDLEGTEIHTINGNVGFKVDKKMYVTSYSYDILKDSVWIQISDDLLGSCRNQLIDKIKEECQKILRRSN